MGVLVFFMTQMQGGGGGKVMSFQKSKAKKIDGGEAKVTFDDVAGAGHQLANSYYAMVNGGWFWFRFRKFH